MKVLVSAASRHGSTAEIARRIGDLLSESGLDPDVLPPEEVEALDAYDAAVLGSAVYVGRWLPPGKDLVERWGREISDRPVWLFSSGPIGDPPKPEEDPVDVADLMTAAGAREHRVFAGKLERKGLSFGEKAVVIALRAPEGDFRDWREIETWAGEIAGALRNKPSAG